MTAKEELVHDLLGYDRLKIIQRPDMFHFSLDSVLLSDFVNINKKVKKIVDLGTGNAPIPLFLSLKTNALITGVEIQEEVYDLAKRSVALNNLESQIEILNADIKGVNKHFGKNQIDLVTCNPPFFKVDENNNKNDSEYKKIARHEILIDLDSIISECRHLCKTGGSLVLVHRTERLEDLVVLLHKHNFHLKRMKFVHSKTNDPSNMILIDATYNKLSKVVVEPSLIVHNEDGSYTKEILDIFNYGRD